MDVLNLVLSFIGAGAGGLLAGYSRKKGENLATKQDIGAITETVSKIKDHFDRANAEASHVRQMIVEAFKAKETLRGVAADKRLEALQRAYELWRKLLHADPKTSEVLIECEAWWDKNCLYLDGPARSAFSAAMHAWSNRSSYLNSGDRSHDALIAIQESWRSVLAAGNEIAVAADLPALSGGEAPSDLEDDAVPN